MDEKNESNKCNSSPSSPTQIDSSNDQNPDANEVNVDLPKELVECTNSKNNYIKQMGQNYRNNTRLKNPKKFLFEMHRNERLWSMKCDQELIDAILVTKNGYQEHVHMDMLLMLNSNINQAMEYKRKLNSIISEYEMNAEISDEILKQIVLFAYNRKIELNNENCIILVDFANKYRIVSLIKYCLEYFILNSTIENMIKGFDLSFKYNYKNHSFKTFIEDNFETIILKEKSKILNLDYPLLFDILISHNLNIVDEQTVWQLICDWINFNENDRFKYLEEFLFKVLRFGRLTKKFLTENVIQNDLYQRLSHNIQEKHQALMERENSSIHSQDGHELKYSNVSFYSQPRKTREFLLVAGGWVEGQTSAFFEIYDYQTNLWLSSKVRMRRTISYFGFEILNGTLYVFGGSNGRTIFSELEAFALNEESKGWIPKCSMIDVRCYVSSTVMNGLIYALGGFNQRTRIRKCECYNPASDTWQGIADLNFARSDASAVTYNGNIYIAGGINDVCIENSVEVYYPQQNIWRLVKPMQTPRTSFAITVFQNKIFALGGNNGQNRLKTVEQYDPEKDIWTYIENMLIIRSTFKAAVLRNELYVVGGYNGQSPICDVEKYVPNKGWTKVKEMHHDRSGLSLIRVPNIFNSIKI